jgi:hypothetical protein
VRAALAVLVALAAPVAAAPLVPVAMPTAHHGGPSIDIRCEPGLEAQARELWTQANGELTRIVEGDLAQLPSPGVIHVQVVADARSLVEVAPAGRGAPPFAIGVAYPDLGVLSIALARNGQPTDAASTLRHELAHLALGASLGEHAPRWLHEGFAYQHSGEWSWDRVETLAGMAWFGGIVPIDELDRGFPEQELPADRAYAESYDFVGYLSRRGRYEDGSDEGDRWPFRKFLAALSHGASMDTAAIAGFGRPIHALFDEWRDALAKRYLFAPVGLIGLAMWIGCALLLWMAWWRRRRVNRARLAEWERQEAREPAVAEMAADEGPRSSVLGPRPDEEDPPVFS